MKGSIIPGNFLQVQLEVIDTLPGHFTLTCNELHYPVTLRPEASMEVSDWLRRLPPVLAGGKDPSGLLSAQELLHSIGTWLWQALFPDGAPLEEREALARGLRMGTTPLLLMVPKILGELPWELLCDPEQSIGKGFLALRRPLIRFNEMIAPTPLIPFPLRVLLLISSPPSLGENSRVDVESERAAVEQATYAMREKGLLHLFVEDIVTPDRVQDALVLFKPHIVHYIGHGGYSERDGGVLVWEDEQGKELAFSGEELANIFRPRNLSAVILHACQTGRSNARMDVRGVAEALTGEGIPAVLAQQANFTYESSQRASKTWYTALTAGQGFAEALFEVRQALNRAGHPDWAVPTLYGSASSLVSILDERSAPAAADPLLSASGAAADVPTPTATNIFVGRHSELRRLHLMLENAPGSGPVMALITGPGGVGKSTLVTQAVVRYGDRYKGTLTLSCKGYQGVELFLKRIGEFLQRQKITGFLEQILPDPKLSTEAKIEEAISALNQAGPFLLIVDNLESVQNDDDRSIRDESLLYLLQKLLTNLRAGRVLVTGRYAVKDLLPQGKFAAYLLHLKMEDLSRYETKQLLLRHPALAQLGETVQRMLVEEFGGLPYVYDILSNESDNQSLALLIHDVQKRITKDREQRSAQEWQKVRQEVIEFAALDEVTRKRLSEASRLLLAKLGVLERPFPLEAIEKGLGSTRAEWQPLLDWSLLHYDSQEQRYHLHSLTKHYIGDSWKEELDLRQAQMQLGTWYEHYADQESHELADYLEAHRLFRAAGQVQEAGRLIMDMANVLIRFGLYPLLRDLCTKTLSDIRESDELLAARTLHLLGMIAQLQGEYGNARRLFLQSLEINERIGDQSGRASALGQLGTIAKDQGDYGNARHLYQQALEVFEQLDDQSGRANSFHQLGIIAQDQGNYDDARRLFLQSLAINERLGNQSGRASSFHQLGMIAQDQGNYDDARRLFLQSLDIDERLGDQSGRANSLGQLGLLDYEQGKIESALVLQIQAYLIFHVLQSPSQTIARRMIMRIRSQMDAVTFMSIWQKFAGNQPLPALSAEDTQWVLLQIVIDFIKAPTWSETKGFLESHPELLQPEIDVILQDLAKQQEQEGARKTVEEHRLLLARCRDKGIEAAFAEIQGTQRPDTISADELNRVCSEVVATLKNGDMEGREVLAKRIEQMLQRDFPIDGGQDFLLVLIAWLRGQETQAFVEKLQSPLSDAYSQMVAAVEKEEVEERADEDDEGVRIEDLPGIVADVLLHGTEERRKELLAALLEIQQRLGQEEGAEGRFFGCLVSALEGGMPESALLEAPFTDLWRAFQDALNARTGE